MRRPTRLTAGAAVATAVLAATLGTGSVAALAAVDPNTDGSPAAGVDQSSAIVVLSQAPLTTAPGTRNAKGRVDMNKQETKSAQAQLAAQRNSLKAWLRDNAPKATVTGEHDLALNAVTVKLNGTSLSTIQAAPNVVSAQYELKYTPLGSPVAAKGAFNPADPDLSLIHATETWGAGKGQGIKVAIVDTGIDITNPCFSDAGYAKATRLGDTRFTNNKVIAARVFSNKTTGRGFTAQALQDHGTHVAGTVACNDGTKATVDGVSIPYALAGVAPDALLGNYNVFPGDEATGITDARSEDILDALEAAYADGMDVANMSLGGDAHGIQDLLTIGVDNLTAAGMVIAVAAGNSGPGTATAESPGSAKGALTAGASSVPHYVGTPVTITGNSTEYGAAAGDFATVDKDLTAPLGVVAGSGAAGLDTACSALPAGSLTGKIAVVARGTCAFSVKIRNAQTAGAVATLVVNNVAGVPSAMGTDGTANQPTIPAYMLPLSTGPAFAAANGKSATIGADPSYIQSPEDRNIMAGFSSAGPVDVSYRIKPDAVAPGVNVLSSVPAFDCDVPPCFAFFQGTSMATPHLAGSAAVLLSQHPKWSPADVKSALVNTADRYSLRTSAGDAYVVDQKNSVQIQGGGLENVALATKATLTLNPVSLSFGAVPRGSGQSTTQKVTVTNNGSGPISLTPAITDAHTQSGVSFSVSGPVTIPAGGSATVTVTVTNAKSATAGPSSAYLVLRAGKAEVAHAAVFEYTK
jgi:minor extracellular serine protease Vpr